MTPKLTADRLRRRGVVYIRQSSPAQVLHHQESRRLQYGLADRARALGFTDVRVIDDDLGRSADGRMDRPGFERLVAEVCSGEVGAVLCLEASRLARNGRDWHHLLELCGMVDAVVIDTDGIYDPMLLNDRLLLGLKGQMSEYELSLFRQRSLEARWQKARRGEMVFNLPAGFCWGAMGTTIEKDPDQRVQQAIALVFRKMLELGSVRQVLVWFRQEHLELPVRVNHGGCSTLRWRPPVYGTVRGILTNPLYAGAYAYGQREVRTEIVDGRPRKSKGRSLPRAKWRVLLRDHHPGYVDWAQYERIQALMQANAFGQATGEAKAGRGGRALLSGMIRCRRCGRMLHVSYIGKRRVPRYECNEAHLRHGGPRCIAFSGLWVEEAVVEELLQAISGPAIDAAVEAVAQLESRRQDVRRSLALEVEQARYEARLACRRYEAVDPDQRLVAAELEGRWNTALQKVRDLEDKLTAMDRGLERVPVPSKDLLVSLAQDLPAVWNAPSTDMRLKQRIIRMVIEEVVADVDDARREIVLVLHWAGGRHSELRLKKREMGQHRWCTPVEAVEVVRQMAGRFPDELIAATLNRLGLRTGRDNTWDKARVYSLRHYQQLPTYDPQQPRTHLTLKEAAQRLRVSEGTVRRLIDEHRLPATQVVTYAPWEIPLEALESEDVRRIVTEIQRGTTRPQQQTPDGQQSMFSVT